MDSLVIFKVTAAVTVLAAGAAAGRSYVSTGFLLSPPFLWLAANVIIVWLLSSSRRRRDDTSSAGRHGDDDVLNAAVDDEFYPLSDYEGYSSSSSVVSSGEAHVVVSKPKRQRQPREARAAPVRRTDRVRVPNKKPVGETAPTTAEAAETHTRHKSDDDKHGEHEMMARTTVAAAAAAVVEASRPEEEEGDDDVSLDSLWQSMVQRRAVRPVAVRKSDTWGNDELPRLQRAAETAAKRREMPKSVSSAAQPPPPPQTSAVRQLGLGWRTRDVLVRAQDDLLRRAESLIRRHHEQLRLQRQESEQRQAMEQQRGRPAPALIRAS